DGSSSQLLKAIEGQPPNMAHPPPGCAFHPRCPYVQGRCKTDSPPLTDHAESAGVTRRFACFVDIRTASAREASHA
ncbi:MAG TPA: hypothetical protein PLV92_26730, partial [Pirellulaceae bacterium]|nr:hypothetical protein [Pirellulaceae bacterium]